MQFLADESCDFAVVRSLRAARYDVKAVAEVALGATDDVVLELALRERRVLLTEDKDFGQLVFAAARSSSGVILVRYPATARSQLPRIILDLVNTEQERLVGSFAVVQPSRIRISREPTDST
jgi:predicted nuclease of predicted toxin-antitoxin system